MNPKFIVQYQPSINKIIQIEHREFFNITEVVNHTNYRDGFYLDSTCIISIKKEIIPEKYDFNGEVILDDN